MKVGIFDGRPWRIRRRDKVSITLIPVDSDNGRKILMADVKQVGGTGTDRWGYIDPTPGRKSMTWYREISPDVFERVSGPRVL